MTEILKKENNKVFFDITLPKEEVKKAEITAYNKLKKNVQIPGFRKGHAPKMIIENVYGKGIFLEDAINELLPKYYEEAIKELELEVVDQPDVDFDEDVSSDADVVVHFSVFVKPEIEIKKYKGLEVEDAKHEVTDEMLEDDLKRQQKMNARAVNIDDRAAEEHDKVNINFEGFIDGEAFPGGTAENQDLELGSGTFIPGFEEQIIGKNIGDEFDVVTKFPEDYHAEEFQGKEATFKTKLNSITVEELPEIDDEFIKDISEFDTVDEYKADLRKKLEKEAEERTRIDREGNVLRKIAEEVEVDIPERMVEDELDRIIQNYNQSMQGQGLTIEQYLQMLGTDIKTFREGQKGQAEAVILNRLILDKIIELENIEVTDEEIEAEIDRVLGEYFKDDEEKREDMKKMMLETNKAAVEDDLKARRALDVLVNENKFVEKKEEKEEKETEENKED
ncbi:trigger factor [Peptoniphilus sp.]|uniref:trigger factor n=1 Tax=Peptoniphilus sp. TaxID=1971214 RepID=UPI00399643E2